MNDGCEQWWERVKDRAVWVKSFRGWKWDHLTIEEQAILRAIYEAAILPQDEDDRELREQAANLTRHPWERGETKEEAR